MSEQQRTTIVLPQDLLYQAKIYALGNKTNVSRLIRDCLNEKIRGRQFKKTKSILELAGSLNLKGKKPLARSKIYEEYLKNKIGS